MQIDFHHGATYVIARLGGLDRREAGIVAYASQYVDDATNAGTVRFHNGARYHRIASAHKALDYSNFERLDQAQVWLPFHFLPSNDLPEGEGPDSQLFAERLVTRPDSAVAQSMMRMVIDARHRPWALHRLGIALHTYVDTWAHQGFSGIRHDMNDASDIRTHDHLQAEWSLAFAERLASFFVDSALPLGHGTVLALPDLPYLRWSYRDNRGRRVVRDNPSDFLAAAQAACRQVRRWIAADPDAEVPGLPEEDARRMADLFERLVDPAGDRRQACWEEAIGAGHFSFGAEPVHYIAKGAGSWKHAALGTERAVDDEDEVFPFQTSFLTSDWKLFHDALQEQRLEILNSLLPRFGICAA